MLRMISATALVGMLLLASCSGSKPTNLAPQVPESTGLTGINLPAPMELTGRAVAASVSLDGADYVEEVAPIHVAKDGTVGVYSPSYVGGESGINDLALALYMFDTTGMDEGIMVELTWVANPAASDLWLAIADYENNSWHWHQAAAADQVAVSGRTRHAKADGTLYVIAAIGGTTESRLEEISVSDFPLPDVVLVADPAPPIGDTPLAVNFDTAGSTSANGALVDYIWNLDGNGAFGESGQPESTFTGQAIASFTYEQSILTTVTVRATDAMGFVGEASIGVTPFGFALDYASLEPLVAGDEGVIDVVPFEVDGMLAIFIRTRQDGEVLGRVLYTRATSMSPLTWGPVVELASSGGLFPGENLTPKLIDGKPAVAYRIMGGAGGLGYVSAQDAQGAAWNAPVEPMTNGDPRSLTVINGKPVLAGYAYMVTPKGMYYVSATDAAGSAWDAPVLVEEMPVLMGTWGGRAAISVVQGNPAVAFRAVDSFTNPNAHELRYCRATDATGTAWGVAVAVDHEDITDTCLILGKDIYLAAWETGLAVGYSRLRYSTMGTLLEGNAYRASAQDIMGAAWNVPIDTNDGSEKAVSFVILGKVIDTTWFPYQHDANHPVSLMATHYVCADLYQNDSDNVFLRIEKEVFETGVKTKGSFDLGQYEYAEITSSDILVEKSPFGPPYLCTLRMVIWVKLGDGEDYVTRKFTWLLESFYSNE